VSVEARAGGRKVVVLSNGLVSRSFLTAPNWATIDLSHEVTGESFLRALAPEARLNASLVFPTGSSASAPPVTVCSASAPIGGVLNADSQRSAILDLESARLVADPRAFRYESHQIVPVRKRFEWQPAAWRRPPPNASWPPKGIGLVAHFAPPALNASEPAAAGGLGAGCLSGMRVSVHYELYEGLPLLAKWLEVHYRPDHSPGSSPDYRPERVSPGYSPGNRPSHSSSEGQGHSPREQGHNSPEDTQKGEHAQDSPAPPAQHTATERTTAPAGAQATAAGLELVVDGLASELLRVPEYSPARIHVETDFMPRKTDWARASGLQPLARGPYAQRRMDYPHWQVDRGYSDNRADEALAAEAAWPALLLRVRYPLGPAQPIPPSASHEFMRVHLLLHDSDAQERQSLARRRVLRTLAPQLLEQPLYFTTDNASSANVRVAVHQLAALGIGTLLLSYGSGVQPASEESAYVRAVAADVEYAWRQGVRVGAYTLMQACAYALSPHACASLGPREVLGLAGSWGQGRC
jgi:hypothetical protein